MVAMWPSTESYCTRKKTPLRLTISCQRMASVLRLSRTAAIKRRRSTQCEPLKLGEKHLEKYSASGFCCRTFVMLMCFAIRLPSSTPWKLNVGSCGIGQQEVDSRCEGAIRSMSEIGVQSRLCARELLFAAWRPH